MNHQAMRQQLFALHDGELSGAARRAAEEHLLDCAECRGLLARWQQVASRLQPDAVFASEVFVERVMQRIARRPAQAWRLSQWLAEGAWLVPAVGLAAMLAVMVAGPLQQTSLSVDNLLLSDGRESPTLQPALNNEAASTDDVLSLMMEGAL